MTAGNRHGRRFRSSHLLYLCSGLTSPPCLVPFMFSVSRDSGLQAPCPSPGPSRKWLCQLPSWRPRGGRQGESQREDREPGSHGAPGLAPPALGTPQPPSRDGEATSGLSGLRFPGLGPQTGTASGLLSERPALGDKLQIPFCTVTLLPFLPAPEP